MDTTTSEPQQVVAPLPSHPWIPDREQVTVRDAADPRVLHFHTRYVVHAAPDASSWAAQR